MIARMWRGYTKPEDADVFEALLKTELQHDIRDAPGFSHSYLLRRDGASDVEFMTVTLWDSLKSIRDFMGPRYEASAVPEERRRHLIRHDGTAAHYEVPSISIAD
ncbi:MAG: antibiotic biosynthesis monooxygenase [Alphaproteobacteria bacterium]|nr:antibiotic biosynthesis monooxygenase [Alphaproteobacteria bacterium]MDE2112011.1 antibiotic biosynthesis monooxygenase [Alphaproteobacteria bacterium]MDE2492331.1 antibiotic biosynthesis monooxygenase [Alphaproteobacteria bacterium]